MTKTTGNFTDFVSFSRASGGTYLDSDGLIKTAATNVPRVEYDASGNWKGLLIEEARTNLVTYSEASTANWTNASSTMTQLSGSYLGAFAGVRVASAGQLWHRLLCPNVTHTAGTVYTVTTFFAQGTSPTWTLQGYSSATTPATLIELRGTFGVDSVGTTVENATLQSYYVNDIGGGLYEVKVSYVLNNAISFAFGVGPYTTTVGQDIIVLGAQLEAGAFPTSYIPTSGATATRAADICSIATSAFGYNQGAGTIVVDVAEFKFGTSGYPRAIEIGNSSTTIGERINLFVSAASGTYSVGFYTANVMQMGGTLASSISSPFVPSKAALTYKTNDGAAAYGGVIKNTDTSIDVVGTSYPRDTLKIGGGTVSATDQINGHIKSIRYYPRRLSNAQIQALTA